MLSDLDFVILFFGRLVLEKGIDVFGQTIAELTKRGVAHKVLVLGDGPARDSFAAQVPGAIFAGHQNGTDLGRAVASVHTRFETYFRYYGLGFLEGGATALQRRFYRKCDAIVAPSESFADVLRAERMNSDIGIWGRGIDRHVFNPARRSLEWRRSLGIADDDFVILFFGRLVLEKGIDEFGQTIAELTKRGVAHKVLVLGDGPARDRSEERRVGKEC